MYAHGESGNDLVKNVLVWMRMASHIQQNARRRYLRTNKLQARNFVFIRTQCIPRSEHSPPRLYETSQLTMRNVKVVCYEIRKKLVNAKWAGCKLF